MTEQNWDYAQEISDDINQWIYDYDQQQPDGSYPEVSGFLETLRVNLQNLWRTTSVPRQFVDRYFYILSSMETDFENGKIERGHVRRWLGEFQKDLGKIMEEENLQDNKVRHSTHYQDLKFAINVLIGLEYVVREDFNKDIILTLFSGLRVELETRLRNSRTDWDSNTD